MDEHIHGWVQTYVLTMGHGQEAEAHPHVKPFADPSATERARVFLGARGFLLLCLCTAPFIKAQKQESQLTLQTQISRYRKWTKINQQNKSVGKALTLLFRHREFMKMPEDRLRSKRE